jgi:flagellar motor switch protein FliN/FliY
MESEGTRDISFLLDVPVALSVELGSKRMTIGGILTLAHGSIIELNKGAQDPLELIVNGKVIATCELVELNGQMAVRILEIVNPTERVKGAIQS